MEAIECHPGKNFEGKPETTTTFGHLGYEDASTTTTVQQVRVEMYWEWELGHATWAAETFEIGKQQTSHWNMVKRYVVKHKKEMRPTYSKWKWKTPSVMQFRMCYAALNLTFLVLAVKQRTTDESEEHSQGRQQSFACLLPGQPVSFRMTQAATVNCLRKSPRMHLRLTLNPGTL